MEIWYNTKGPTIKLPEGWGGLRFVLQSKTKNKIFIFYFCFPTPRNICMFLQILPTFCLKTAG